MQIRYQSRDLWKQLKFLSVFKTSYCIISNYYLYLFGKNLINHCIFINPQLQSLMKNLYVAFPALLVMLSLFSCASGYKEIKPITVTYISSDTASGVTMEYKYDLLQNKYGKKEKKKNLKLVALKIKNEGQQDLVFGKDLKLTFNNGNEIQLLDKEIIYKSLKQIPPAYLAYLLLTPINLTVETPSSRSVTPVGFVAGPLIALGNFLVALSSNKKFKSELDKYYLNGVMIRAGDEHHGIISFYAPGYEAIKLKIDGMQKIE